MATLGERVFTFKADFRQAIAGADGFIKTLGKVALGITAIGVAWVGVTKIMQTQAWGKFAASASAAFVTVGKSIAQLLHHVSALEFGLLAFAGPLGKFVVGLTELSAAAGIAGTALQAMGVPLAGLLVTFSKVGAGIAAGTQVALFALGKLTEVIGDKLANAASRWLEVGLDFERQQYGLERSVRAFTAATGDASVSADELVTKIRNISAETGIAAAEIKQGVNVMFEMSRVTKLTGTQMDELIKAMADFSIVRGVAFTEVVYAVDQSFRGWHQSASALGLTLDNNSVQAQAAQQGFDKLGQVQGQAAETTNRFQAALHQMQALGLNAASESADKLASGALRKLQGELNTIHGLLGLGVARFWQPFYKILGDTARLIRETLGESLLGFIGFMTQFVAIVFKSIGLIVKWSSVLVGMIAVIGLARNAIALLTVAMGGFNGMLLLTSRGLMRIAALMGQQFGAPLVALATRFTTAAAAGTSFGSVMMQLSRIVGVALVQSFTAAAAAIAVPAAIFAAFVTTVYLLVKAFQAVEEETQAFSTAWKAMGQIFGDITDIIVELAREFGVISGAVSVFKTIVVNSFKIILDPILALGEAFVEVTKVLTKLQIAYLEWKQMSLGLTAEDEGRLKRAQARLESLNKTLERTAEMRGKLGFTIETGTARSGTTGAGARQREEREGSAREATGIFETVTAYSALDESQKNALETRTKLAQAMGNMIELQKVEREIFMAQTKDQIAADKQLAPERARKRVAELPPGLSQPEKKARELAFTEEEINKANQRGMEQLERFNAQKLAEQNSYLEKYGRILGMEARLAAERVEAEVDLLDKSLINEEQAIQIRTALYAGALSELQQFNAKILAEQGRHEEAFQVGLDAEINALRAQGVKEEEVMAIRTKKMKDESDRRLSILSASARERAAAEAGVATAAAGAVTGPTSETIALNAEIQLKQTQIELENKLNDIRRAGINVAKLSADEYAKAKAAQMQIELNVFEQQKSLLLQRTQLLRDANKEMINAAVDFSAEYLRVTNQAFAGQILQLTERSTAIQEERDERIAAITASAAEVQVKEAQITSAFHTEALRRQQLVVKEFEVRRNALLEYFNLSADLERRERDRRRGKEDLREAQEDLAIAKGGRPLTARAQRERQVRSATRRVEDLTRSDFEKRAEEMGEQDLRQRLQDARNIAFGGQVVGAGPEAIAGVRGQNNQLLGQQTAQVNQLNQSMEALRVRAVDSLTASMSQLDGIIRQMTGQPAAAPAAAAATADQAVMGQRITAFAGPGGAEKRMESLEAQAENSRAALERGDLSAAMIAPGSMSNAERAEAITPTAGVSMNRMPQQMSEMWTDLQKVFNSGVDAMVASFKDKTAGIPQSILAIVKEGLPEELTDQKRRSRGDR